MSMDTDAGGAESRRAFVGGLLMLGVVVATGLPRVRASTTDIAPRARGSARIDVRDHGAKGDGIHDDTAAFQAAVDALPAAGGTVNVAAGDYLIDPTRSVRLRSRMRLALAPGATLRARPNAEPKANVLRGEGLQDVEISGGRIVGERDSHLGTTGEWGHGIRLRACQRVTVRDLQISRCWGDGISAGGYMSRGRWSQPGSDLLLVGVVCEGNRRQGLTLGSYRGVRVSDCQFNGNGGTAPGAGIDIEPDADVARDIVMENCGLSGNPGAGFQLFKRAAAVTVRNCTIERNGGPGILAVAALDSEFNGNRIQGNRGRGVSVRAGSRNIRVDGNPVASSG